jgi:hypothetical protein
MSLSNGRIRRSSSLERRDPYASPEIYYGKEDGASSLARNRIWSTKSPAEREVVNKRRASHGKAYGKDPN